MVVGGCPGVEHVQDLFKSLMGWVAVWRLRRMMQLLFKFGANGARCPDRRALGPAAKLR